MYIFSKCDIFSAAGGHMYIMYWELVALLLLLCNCRGVFLSKECQWQITGAQQNCIAVAKQDPSCVVEARGRSV